MLPRVVLAFVFAFLPLLPCAAVAAPLAPPDQVVRVHASTALPDTAVVSPDGRQLAFAVREGDAHVLVVVDLDTLEAKRLPLPVFPSLTRFDPSGKAVWFADGRDLWRFRLDEPQAAKWRSLDQEVDGLAVAAGDKVYARLRLSLGRGQFKGPVPRGVAGAEMQKLCLVPEKGDPRPLVLDFVADGAEVERLPGGDLVLDASYPDPAGQLNEREIVRLSPSGARTRLTKVRGNCYSPGVSADGTLVAAPCDKGGRHSLRLVDVAKKRVTTVFEDSDVIAAGRPAFSPDGKTIALAFRKDAWNAWIVDAAGGKPVRVSDLPEASVLGFARSGRAIVIESEGALHLAIWK